MLAYKFLERGAVGPFTRFRWPVGDWVEARSSASGAGIHACRHRDLAFWLNDELWRVELDGAQVEHPTQLEARRARLVERVPLWNADVATAFAVDCAFRIRDRGAAALEREGLRSEASRFAAHTTRAELAQLDRDAVVAASPRAAELAGYAADAARRAASPKPNGASFMAAVAAVVLRGSEAAFAEERAWQGELLRDRLGL